MILCPYCQTPNDFFCGDKNGRCKVDGDCADAGEAKATCYNGYCGGACAACTSSNDCLPGYTCSGTSCEPASCMGDTDCAANMACNMGKCGLKACTSDGQCQGYCVEGYCHSELGTCGVTGG